MYKQIRTIYTWNWTCQVYAIIHSFGSKKLAPCKNFSWLLYWHLKMAPGDFTGSYFSEPEQPLDSYLDWKLDPISRIFCLFVYYEWFPEWNFQRSVQFIHFYFFYMISWVRPGFFGVFFFIVCFCFCFLGLGASPHCSSFTFSVVCILLCFCGVYFVLFVFLLCFVPNVPVVSGSFIHYCPFGCP